MIILLAWKNIWRNKKRSFIIIAATALGLWGGLFATAIMIGMWETAIDAAINRDLSHLQIHQDGFTTEKQINNFIENPQTVFNAISSLGEIENYSARTVIEGMASSPTSSRGIKILGIDPANEKKITDNYKKIIEGSYFEKDIRNQIVIGKKLADKLKLKMNSKLVCSFQGLDASIVYASFRISGIFSTESSTFDEMNVFVLQSDLNRLLNVKSLIHEIAIRTKSSLVVDTIKSQLKLKLPILAVDSWKDLAPEFRLTQETLYIQMYFFVGIILFALLFGIMNTMLMSVLERVREFGMLMAVGMKRIRVFLLILFETIMLSLVGGMIGVLLAAATTEYFAIIGINLSAFTEGLAIYGVSPMLYPDLPLNVYFVLSIMIVSTSIIAAIYPSYKAIRLQPAVAIRTF
ncbi:MAG: ABC transporter permease [Ignavibacteria bacterium]|nr:ABC transporter permease [Ignavibacteria bacterium]